jgi:hypothetical protein
VITEGASEQAAREMVESALRDRLEFYVQSEAGGTVEVPSRARSEPLELTIAA